MALYAKITRGLEDTGERKRDIVVIPASSLAPGKPYWVPVVEEVQDTSTGSDVVRSEPVKTVEDNRVHYLTTIRDKTPAEIDAEDTSRAAGLMANAGPMRALALAVFDQENRLRALEGRQAITAAQFRGWLKSKIRGGV